jgi:hypothetical protein
MQASGSVPNAFILLPLNRPLSTSQLSVSSLEREIPEMFNLRPLHPLLSTFPSRKTTSHQDVLNPEVFNLIQPRSGTALGDPFVPDFLALPPLHQPSLPTPLHPRTSTPEPSSSRNDIASREAFDMKSMKCHLPISPFRPSVSRQDTGDLSQPRTPEQHRFAFSSMMGEPSGSLSKSFAR